MTNQHPPLATIPLEIGPGVYATEGLRDVEMEEWRGGGAERYPISSPLHLSVSSSLNPSGSPSFCLSRSPVMAADAFMRSSTSSVCFRAGRSIIPAAWETPSAPAACRRKTQAHPSKVLSGARSL